MVNLPKITKIIAPVVLLLAMFSSLAPAASAADTSVRVKLRSSCHRDGCDMKMTTNRENQIQVNTNEAFFLSQGMMKRHHHFSSFLPAAVYARELTIVNRDAPGNTFNLRNDLTGPSSVNINEVTVNVSDTVFKQIEHNIYTNQSVSIEVNTGNNTISFNTVFRNISAGDISFALR